MSRLVILICTVGIALLPSCRSGNPIMESSQMTSYGNPELEMGVSFMLFHVDADSTRLFIRLQTDNLLYAKRQGESAKAVVLVEIKPKAKDGAKISGLKSKTIRIVDEDDTKAPKDLIASTSLKLPAGSSYVLEIKLFDLNRQKSQVEFVVADKSDRNERQNYIAAAEDMSVPLFTDRVQPYQNYILATNTSSDRQVCVRYYNRSFALPPPPFVTTYLREPFDYKPDSVFTLTLNSRNQTDFTTGGSGFYHFQTDSTQKEGFTLFVSASEFPEVTQIQNMIDPFRYLVGGKEYRLIIDAAQPKPLLESYWIDWAGSTDRARKSIKSYYGRVEEANRFFSSHVEGWKSDRGLVYIIYGQPNKVYRSNVVETWIYGEENNPLSITFNFLRVVNPFTDNDYSLNREEFYKPSWYRSVNAWRDGRIY